jgi:hypothetical protein
LTVCSDRREEVPAGDRSMKNREAKSWQEPAVRHMPGCEELKQRGLLEDYECCKICHSPRQFVEGSLGPCCVTLPDGREAFVCCTGKKRLLERRAP